MHARTQLFEADKELVPLDQARRFPAFEAESLLGVTHHFQTLLTQAPQQVHSNPTPTRLVSSERPTRRSILSIKRPYSFDCMFLDRCVCPQQQQLLQQVSLVALSFRDSGFRTLPDWIKPFQHEFGGLINGSGGAMRVFQVNLEDKGWLRVRAFGSGFCLGGMHAYAMVLSICPPPPGPFSFTHLRCNVKNAAAQVHDGQRAEVRHRAGAAWPKLPALRRHRGKYVAYYLYMHAVMCAAGIHARQQQQKGHMTRLTHGPSTQLNEAFTSHHVTSIPIAQAIREGLGVDNRMVGYVFLVDGKGRARWR